MNKKRKQIPQTVAADIRLQAESVLQHGAELSQEAVRRGKALILPLLEQIRDPLMDDPDESMFKEPFDYFQLALQLDANNLEARDELQKLQEVFHPATLQPRPSPNHTDPYDVIIVGAGASGIGIGLMLTRMFNLDPNRVLLLERGNDIGESFLKWPKEMRFISPSFNQQGWTGTFDLNSVAFGTSPAYTLQSEHPTGEEYAFYLKALSEAGKLNVQTLTNVTAARTHVATCIFGGPSHECTHETDLLKQPRDVYRVL